MREIFSQASAAVHGLILQLHHPSMAINLAIPGSNSTLNGVVYCLLVLLLLTALIQTKIFFFGSSKPSCLALPPGPRGWPLVGCLLQLREITTSGVGDFVQKYGPIFTLQIGSKPIIVITDAETIHEAFVEKGSVFSSRPCDPSAALLTSNYRSIGSAPYGPRWRTLRKALVSGYFSSSKAFRDVREEAVQHLLQKLRDEAAHNAGIVVRVREIIKYGFFDLLLSLCFGKHARESVVHDVAQILKHPRVLVEAGIDDFIPWLRFIPWRHTKQIQELRQEQLNVLLPLIREAQGLRQDGKLPGGSYIHSLLAVDLEGKMLSDDELVTLCFEFLTGGTDTTATALEWAMANIISQPKIQAQIVSEMERVVGKRAAQEEDLDSLPYLGAVAKETLRRHPPASFTLPHCLTQPCKLRGYNIPSNARVVASISSIANDPSIWENPTQFNPDRFLRSDHFDITGSRKVTLIPFGTGRRICPGLGLATLNLNFILARLMQSFEWSTAAPDETVDLTPMFELTTVMKSPLRALIKAR